MFPPYAPPPPLRYYCLATAAVSVFIALIYSTYVQYIQTVWGGLW